MYPLTVVDSNGDQLVGSNGYVLHFERDQIPPASAFWSLTLYDEKGFFVENPIGRFVIGDRHDLYFNPCRAFVVRRRHSPAVPDVRVD